MSPNPDILEENEMTMSEVSSEIEKIKKRDKELNFRAQKTEEYLNQFSKLKPKDTKELEKNILELNIPRLKEAHVKKIVDILPSTPEDVKMILSGFSITINQENLKKISSLIPK
jgi:DNA-directed RNA polymerase subunit F